MIKFFRKIRYGLMEKNKTRKYFKYAIGEIVLVVIGILIALQVNNWNQIRISKNNEIEILEDFQKGLINDIQELNHVIAHYERSKVSIEKVLYYLDNDLPYTDSLKYDFFSTNLIRESGGLSTSIFETLKSRGFDLISNKNLRNSIIRLYDEYDPWLKSWDKRYIEVIFDAERNIYNTRFYDFWNGDYKNPSIKGTMVPIDYESLKNDKEYKYLLRTQRNLIGWLIMKPVDNTLVEIKELTQMIEKELETQ